MAENYFKQLYDIDVSNKKKSKNGLNYLSWAACWSEVKKMFPDATFKIYEQMIKIVETSEGKESQERLNALGLMMVILVGLRLV